MQTHDNKNVMTDHHRPQHDHPKHADSVGLLNRRAFIKQIAAGLALGASAPLQRALGSTMPTTQQSQPSDATARPTVFLVRFKKANRLLRSQGINRTLLREMIATGLCELAGTPSLARASKELFHPKDIIGFKFDKSVDHLFKTNQVLCEELFRLFLKLGFSPNQLMFIDAKPADPTLPAPLKPPFGWTEPIDFGSGRDSFSIALEKITALVNVPVLRADAIGGINGCLKNITYGMLRHPARFYKNNLTPFIADIYNLPLIKNKIRFHLLNSLKVPIRTDILDTPDAIRQHESLLLGYDPVAVDAVGFEIIERMRNEAGLPPLVRTDDFPKHLILAARRGIGKHHPDQIELRPLWLE